MENKEEKDNTIKALNGLLEVASLAPVPKQVHLQCEQMHKELMAFINTQTNEKDS